MNYQGKQVLVLGLGESGLAMALWLARCGAAVRVADTRAEPARLKALRDRRDNDQVQSALAELTRRASNTENLLPAILAAVQSYATVGEISNTLRHQFGEYRESVVI